MGRTSLMIVAASLLLTATSGCGTTQNMKGQPYLLGNLANPTRPPMPFGGVIMDGNAFVTQVIGGIFSPETLIFAPIALIDLPFSFVGDVVTLPWATYEFITELRSPSDRYRWPNQPPIGDADKGQTPAADSSDSGAPNLRKRD